jgi:hypothetical protein
MLQVVDEILLLHSLLLHLVQTPVASGGQPLARHQAPRASGKMVNGERHNGVKTD